MTKTLWHPSPNFGPRRDGLRPRLVMLHYTAMASCTAARDWLCNPVSEVSAHFLIDRDGTLIQMVAEQDRAWHAGAGSWHGCSDVNSASIGIELANTGAEPFAAPQMNRLEHVLRSLLHRYAIPPQGVIAHSDSAPGRKQDPGARFDWHRLARQGLAATPSNVFTTRTPAPTPAPKSETLDLLLTQAGYTSDAPLATRLAAFRLRARAQATGPADSFDLALLQQVVDAARLSVF